MFSISTGVTPSRTIAVSSLLLLAACGGGGGSDPSPGPSGSSLPELAASYTDLAPASTVGKVTPWTAGTATGAPIDGVVCAASEAFHAHAVVSIYQDGVRLAVPAQIGLSGCAYELHTHDATGIVHLEAATQKTFTLGQFFSVWGQPLSAAGVAGLAGTPKFYTIDNETVAAFTGDPRTIALAAHREIAIVVGNPPAKLDKDRLPPGY